MSKITAGNEHFQFEVDTSDIERYADDFEEEVIDRMLELTGFALQGELKREAPGGKTGDLRKRISAPRRIGGSAFAIDFGVDYWTFVNFGTKPHIIRPRRASVLRFEKEGAIVFAKVVRHPGTKANPFVDRAIDNMFEHLPSIAQQALQEAK